MSSTRKVLAVVLVVFGLLAFPGRAVADVPVGPPRPAACPPGTEDPRTYSGPLVSYRCHSAVVDPTGRTVVLRQGRSGPSAFGMLHALLDHNVQDHVIERVVSSAFPISAPGGRVRYIAEFRHDGFGVMAVWVEVDRSPSKDAPDAQPFGVVTAYCKVPARANVENLCPEWVNDSL